MRRVEVKCKATGDIQAAYDKADYRGKQFIESQQGMKNEVLGRVRFRKGEGSSIRIKPSERGVFRNGRFQWIKL